MKLVRHSLPALVAALLAVLSLVWLGAAPMARAAVAGEPGVHVCTAMGGGGTPAPHGRPCDHCPLCAGLATPPILPHALPRLKLPTELAAATTRPATPAAPHRPATFAASPRGPPA